MQDLITQLEGARGTPVNARNPHADRVDNLIHVMKLPYELVQVDEYFRNMLEQYAYPNINDPTGLGVCFWGAMALCAGRHLTPASHRAMTDGLVRTRDSMLGAPGAHARAQVPERLRNILEVLNVV